MVTFKPFQHWICLFLDITTLFRITIYKFCSIWGDVSLPLALGSMCLLGACVYFILFCFFAFFLFCFDFLSIFHYASTFHYRLACVAVSKHFWANQYKLNKILKTLSCVRDSKSICFFIIKTFKLVLKQTSNLYF